MEVSRWRNGVGHGAGDLPRAIGRRRRTRPNARRRQCHSGQGAAELWVLAGGATDPGEIGFSVELLTQASTFCAVAV